MSIRNVVILFVSTMAVTLVILIVLFSLFFKNVDLAFDTRIPESAPDLRERFPEQSFEESQEGSENPFEALEEGASSADLPAGARVNVPSRSRQNPDWPDEGDVGDTGAAEEVSTSPAVTPVEPSPSSQPPSPPSKKLEVLTTKVTEPPPPPSPRPILNTIPVPAQAPATAEKNDTAVYQVYLDGFSSREAAQAKAEELRGKGVEVLVKETNGKAIVQLGRFSNKQYAQDLASRNGAKVSSSP